MGARPKCSAARTGLQVGEYKKILSDPGIALSLVAVMILKCYAKNHDDILNTLIILLNYVSQVVLFLIFFAVFKLVPPAGFLSFSIFPY